jgi:hypothetical protein
MFMTFLHSYKLLEIERVGFAPGDIETASALASASYDAMAVVQCISRSPSRGSTLACSASFSRMCQPLA